MYLITGGAGFIGSHVVDRLIERGDSVTCFDDFNDFYAPEIKRSNIRHHLGNPRFTLVEGDICDAQQLESLFRKVQITKVLHLAARTGVRHSLKDPGLYEEVNVRGTFNVLEECRKHRIPRFVFASSSSIYGNCRSAEFHEDDTTGRPISPYASTKYTAELLCHAYHHLYKLPVTILRFFSVYGPRQRPDMAIYKFVESIRRKRPISVFGDGSTSRDYTCVDDIVEGTLAAMNRTEPFDVFNLGNSFAVSLKELVQTLHVLCDRPIRAEMLPGQPGDVDRTCADISRARSVLGYNPQTNLMDGLTEFVRWFDRRRIEPVHRDPNLQ